MTRARVPHICDICDKSLGDAGSLNKHVEIVHLSKIKDEGCPYKCEEGKGAKFGDLEQLEKHLKVCKNDKEVSGVNLEFLKGQRSN